jgi:hypothetical protein
MQSLRTDDDLSAGPVWGWTAFGCVVICSVALVSGFILGRGSGRPQPEQRVQYRMLPTPGMTPETEDASQAQPAATESDKDIGALPATRVGGRI